MRGESWTAALRGHAAKQAEAESVRQHNAAIHAASAHHDASQAPGLISAIVGQGSGEWHALRESRLTASAFGNAVGFWRGGMVRRCRLNTSG